MITAAVSLRDKARDYEINALAARDRGELTAANAFTTVAIVLFEVADALELQEAEAA